MSLPTVDRALGKKYPTNPDELVEYVQRVMGPVVEDLRRRYNTLRSHLAVQIEENEAAILAVDASDMLDGTMMINSETGDVYALDADGTPGAGDLAANPTGAWYYEFSL